MTFFWCRLQICPQVFSLTISMMRIQSTTSTEDTDEALIRMYQDIIWLRHQHWPWSFPCHRWQGAFPASLRPLTPQPELLCPSREKSLPSSATSLAALTTSRRWRILWMKPRETRVLALAERGRWGQGNSSAARSTAVTMTVLVLLPALRGPIALLEPQEGPLAPRAIPSTRPRLLALMRYSMRSKSFEKPKVGSRSPSRTWKRTISAITPWSWRHCKKNDIGKMLQV